MGYNKDKIPHKSKNMYIDGVGAIKDCVYQLNYIPLRTDKLGAIEQHS